MSGTAQNELFGINKSLVGVFKNIRPSTPLKSRLYDANIENLKMVIEYLTQMKNTGKLNEKEFSDLITHACSSFVENEIASAIDKVFVNTLKGLFEEFEDEW
jgi:hypothetical protein